MRLQARVQAGQRHGRDPPGALRAAGEDRDRAPVDRAGGERATDRELHAGGAVVAAEQQHVDHLPGGVRASVTVGQPGPQLIEALRPRAAVALLGQRDRVLQSAGLSRQQLEVVVELGAGPELAVQPLMPGDLAADVVDRDLPGADPGATFNPASRTGTE